MDAGRCYGCGFCTFVPRGRLASFEGDVLVPCGCGGEFLRGGSCVGYLLPAGNAAWAFFAFEAGLEGSGHEAGRLEAGREEGGRRSLKGGEV